MFPIFLEQYTNTRTIPNLYGIMSAKMLLTNVNLCVMALQNGYESEATSHSISSFSNSSAASSDVWTAFEWATIVIWRPMERKCDEYRMSKENTHAVWKAAALGILEQWQQQYQVLQRTCSNRFQNLPSWNSVFLSQVTGRSWVRSVKNIQKRAEITAKFPQNFCL